MLFAAFAPAMSHAGAAKPSAQLAWFADICSASGNNTARFVDHVPNSGDGDTSSERLLEHCGYCLPQLAWHGLPSAPVSLIAVLRVPQVRIVARAEHVKSHLPWQFALARAPPVIS